MKDRRRSLLLILLLVTLVTVSTYWRSFARENSAQEPGPPTIIAPFSESDVSDLEIWPTSASLERPLESPIDALQQLVILDADWAQWEEPWGVDSLTVTPDRIIVENYPTRTEESKAMSLEEWFHPAIDEDAGHVWSITIKGNVKLRLLGSGVEGPVFADGVNYVISARTGKLLAIRAGIPEKLK